ncbi:FAD-binding protein [Amycolatopsis acidicola]|uniref:FAD-binding protein n=1 Tax=Amycolatopsis acidicola TaxID=2596893 RepID=A0A5N0VN80_9PSEU|nr:FAD-dependent monooxygenase [Amycolatopsis acidicola]KAA9166650.1 FAD-binding protein [Amycolatopsis acidicola]
MDADVIVAGSGPAGLMLACELALAGTDVLVIDKLAERSGQSKALNLQPRTAEVLQLRGLLDEAEGRSLGRVSQGHFAKLVFDYGVLDTRFPFQVGIPQGRVEAVLEERLGELGVTVRRGVELVDLTQDERGVEVTVAGSDVPLRARYLVGCDGGRSVVRKRLGVGFPGVDARNFGTVADVVLAGESADVPKVWNSMLNLGREREDGAFAHFIPLSEPGLYRLVYADPALEIEDQRAPVPADEPARIVRRFYGDEIRVGEVRWASRYSDASRQAEHYRVGRVLLAGDAAHIHLPAGGQGLNLSVQDSMNLGWKLALVVAGSQPESFLDTYHAERHPVGAGVIANTRAQAVLMSPDPEARALRGIFDRLLHTPDGEREIAGMVSGLDIRYELGDEHELVGSRLPDLDLPAGIFRDGHGVLLSTDDEILAEARPWAGRVETVRMAELPGAEAILVRPDGYVCWAAPGKPVTGALAAWFGAA